MKNLILTLSFTFLFFGLQGQADVDISGSCFSGTVSIPFVMNVNSKPAYNQPNGNFGGLSPVQLTIQWTGTQWTISVSGGTVVYVNTNDTPFPPDDLWSQVQAPSGCPFGSSVSLSGGVSAVTLPIELSSFSGEVMTNAVKLSWTTQSEFQNDFFQIEKSLDGSTFSQIGSVPGYGTTDVPQAYGFMDEAPTSGNNYYRLKQVDLDGQFSYSPIISIQMEPTSGAEGFVIYPMPVDQEIFIRSVQPIKQANLYDLNGRLVSSFSYPSQGLNSTSLPVTSIASGMYVLNVKLHDGQQWFEKIRKK